MAHSFREADRIAAELAPELEEFPWFHGIAVEEDPQGYLVCVRVDPATSLEEARVKSMISPEMDGVRIKFRHREMPKAFKVAL